MARRDQIDQAMFGNGNVVNLSFHPVIPTYVRLSIGNSQIVNMSRPPVTKQSES